MIENLQEWILEAIHAIHVHDPATIKNQSLSLVKDVALIIMHESSGNPKAINNWDSNAQAGHPSKGLMQLIDSTFQEYKLPGHDNIFEPVSNIIAGIRYANARYGSIENTPGIQATRAGKAYVGY